MADNSRPNESQLASRRDFIKASSALMAGGAVAGSLNVARGAHAFGSDVIKVGLIGCGGRGSGAAGDAVRGGGGAVKVMAMADVFEDQIQKSLRGLKSQLNEAIDVPKDRQFIGM